MDRGDLEEEVEEWVDDGVVSPEQADEILARYQDDGASRAVKVVALAGAALVAVGVLLLVAAGWESIPVAARFALLAAASAAFLGAGWYTDREGYGRVADGAYLIGVVVGCVSLLPGSEGLNRLLGTAYLTETWILFVACVLSASVAYRAATVPSLALADALLGGWVLSVFDGEVGFLFALPFCGILLYAISFGHLSTRWSSFVDVHKAIGAAAVLGGLFLSLVGFDAAEVADAGFPALSVVGLAGVASVAYSWTADEADTYEVWWAASAFGVSVLPTVLATLAPTRFASVVFDVLFLGLVLLTMVSGYSGGSRYVLNVGVVGFVAYVAYVYVTTVFEVEFVPDSVALIVGGLILIAGGYFGERRRRETIESMDEGDGPDPTDGGEGTD